MRSRLISRIVTVATLLPLLALAISGLGYSRYRCTFSGQVSEASCCPDDATSPSATPTMTSASCCAHESAAAARATAEPASALADLAVAPYVVAVSFEASSRPAPTSVAHPIHLARPSLRLVKQSFLI